MVSLTALKNIKGNFENISGGYKENTFYHPWNDRLIPETEWLIHLHCPLLYWIESAHRVRDWAGDPEYQWAPSITSANRRSCTSELYKPHKPKVQCLSVWANLFSRSKHVAVSRIMRLQRWLFLLQSANNHPQAENINAHFTNPHNVYLQFDPRGFKPAPAWIYTEKERTH